MRASAAKAADRKAGNAAEAGADGASAGRLLKPDPTSFVELRDGCQATPEELIAFCRERLAGFKTPKHVVFGVLPKTTTGKIQKYLLRETARGL